MGCVLHTPFLRSKFVSRKKKNNVVKYHKGFELNIGFIVFFVIIIYVIFHIFTYFTSKPISEYEVQQGTIATNNIYKGLIIRSESVVYAEESGQLNYYVANGSKVSSKDVVYSVDTDGSVSSKITGEQNDSSAITDKAADTIISDINSFSSGYDKKSFSKVYTFKSSLASTLTQELSQNALTNLSDMITNAEANNTFYTYNPASPGVVSYGIDGYEDVTTDNFTLDQFNNSNYNNNDLSENTTINQLDPVYKLVTSENWNILVNVSDDMAKVLNDKSVIQIRFCEDDFVTTVSFDILKKDNEYFLKLNLKNSLIRYINERFTNIELVLNSNTGLKIPNSAITQKEFFTIPKNLFTESGSSSDLSVMVQDKSSNSVTIVKPTIFSENDDFYFVDDDDLKEGDIIQQPDSSSTYTVGTDKDKLTGVYNINKGYAVFKQIKKLSENDNYTIVESKTSFGISLYDHIALDGSAVKENQTIRK